jgi:hypothetical protein
VSEEKAENTTWATLLPEDVRWCVRLLGPKLVETIKKYNLMVAGGFIRAAIAREEPNDIDVFPKGEFDVDVLADNVCKELHGWSQHRRDRIKTDNAVTILCNRIPVQIVHRWKFEDPMQCIESFDYTIARAAIWWNGTEWQSACDDRFYQDLAAKRLVYCSPRRQEEAGGSMLRLFKFYQKGYRAPLDTITNVSVRWLEGVKLPMGHADFNKVALALLIAVDPNADPTRDGHL